MKKDIKCKKCRFHNLEGTTYCQNCGSLLKSKRGFSLLAGGMFASITRRGASLAPLTAIAVENQSQSMAQKARHAKPLVKVIPLKNGSWYCPDCGQRNISHSICHGCGREFT